MSKKSREDWIRGGQKALAEQGVEGVRVERLAKVLGVTKGSFYWHFADRNELLVAMLEDWAEWATETVIERADGAGETPIERLKALVAIVTLGFKSDLEFELRAWARRSPSVAGAVEQVDLRRTGYVRELLCAEGFAPVDAEARAFMLYSILLCDDLIAKSVRGRASRKEILLNSIDLLIRKPLGE